LNGIGAGGALSPLALALSLNGVPFAFAVPLVGVVVLDPPGLVEESRTNPTL
jgi:hypothetical protein